MSIKAMTWAFALPLEPRAKLALLAIADNARDDGVAWPSRETIAEKSSQSRSTVSRRIKALVGLGVIAIFERYREDGTQTTDEIRLDLSLSPADVLRKMHDSGETNEAENDDDSVGSDAGAGASAADRGGCQADTPGSQSGHPGGAVVTGGGSQSGHPQDEPSLEQDSPPNPPPGGPLSKSDREAIEKRGLLWTSLLGSYPGIGRMDQQAAKAEFDRLSVDDAEWAVGSLGQFKLDLVRDKVPPKAAHLWLRKEMFRNYPRAKIEPPPPEQVWIAEGSEADRSLRFVRNLVRQPTPFVRTLPDGSRAYRHKSQPGADLLAMLLFEGQSPFGWPKVDRGTKYFAAWQSRLTDWIGQPMPTEPGTEQIRVPTLWPPKKDGTIYRDHEEPEEGST